jgi:hypothetical protein
MSVAKQIAAHKLKLYAAPFETAYGFDPTNHVGILRWTRLVDDPEILHHSGKQQNYASLVEGGRR